MGGGMMAEAESPHRKHKGFFLSFPVGMYSLFISRAAFQHTLGIFLLLVAVDDMHTDHSIFMGLLFEE